MTRVPPLTPPATRKSETAFRTIGEVSTALGVPQHVLRYWETRFPQLKPLQRAGNRRYYRPDDIGLLRRIQTLLDQEGFTIRGVQQVLAEKPVASTMDPASDAAVLPDARLWDELVHVRQLLVAALDQDGVDLDTGH